MDRDVIKELLSRFRKPADLRGPINYYRQLLFSLVLTPRRERLDAVYQNPITVPTALLRYSFRQVNIWFAFTASACATRAALNPG